MRRPVIFLHRHFVELIEFGSGGDNVCRRINPDEAKKEIPVWLPTLGKKTSVDIVLSRGLVMMKTFFPEPVGIEAGDYLARNIGTMIPWKPQEIVFDYLENLAGEGQKHYTDVIAPKHVFCDALNMVKESGRFVKHISVSSLEKYTFDRESDATLLISVDLKSTELIVYKKGRLLFCRECPLDILLPDPKDFVRQCLLFSMDFCEQFPRERIRNVYLAGRTTEAMKNAVREIWGIRPGIISPDQNKYFFSQEGRPGIELLPSDERRRQDQARRRVQIRKILAPLGCLLLIGAVQVCAAQLRQIRQTEILESRISQLRDREREAAGILALWKEVHHDGKQKPDAIAGITAILTLIPEDIFFQKIEFHDGRLFLNGIARKEESVRDMQNHLRQSQKFAGIRAGSISRYKLLRKDWYRFEMVVEL